MSKSKPSIAVIGLGYVGLPLALLASRKGHTVIGIDVDSRKLSALAANQSYIDDVDSNDIATSSATFTDDAAVVKNIDAIIVCVPTPVTHDKQPDLGPVKSAVTSIAKFLKPGSLLVIESTINPGVCDDIIIPLVEKESGLKIDKDIYLAHCPERINPGDPKWNVSNINRVVGANSPESLSRAVDLYESLIDATIKPMQSLKEAEAVKVVENSFRDINIAFVNELAMSFDKLGINVVNVIDGAATKPFAFMPHYPGIGVGGHCIPVDPYYLIEYASTYGFEHNFLRLARSINEGMPQYTVDTLMKLLNEKGKALKGTTIALLGLSYKANIGDDRESPSHVVREILDEAGAKLRVYDEHVPTKSNVSSLDEALEDAEAVVIASAHDEFKSIDVATLKETGVIAIVDGRNILSDKAEEIAAAGILYKGIGT